MSHYFLVKWVEPEDINTRYNICIRRSILNPRVPFDQIRAGDQLRIKKRGSKVVRLATMYMRSGEIQPLLAIREMIKQLEASQGSVTIEAESSSERHIRIKRLMRKLMQQLTTTADNPVQLGMDNNNNRRTTTPRQGRENELVPIGSGVTVVPRHKYNKVNWRSYTIATRTLLCAVFPRRILATHSLTGKKSPAFQNKPAKMCLNTRKTSDIIIEIMNRFKIKRNLIRNIITIKCADECKMQRTRDQKMQRTRDNKNAKR